MRIVINENGSNVNSDSDIEDCRILNKYLNEVEKYHRLI